MRSTLGRFLPHPALSAFLVLTWLLLNNNVGPGYLVMGILLGLAIPAFTRRFWPEAPRVSHWTALGRYLLMVLWDILLANMAVARLVFEANDQLRPAFIEMPIRLTDEFAITVLTSTISLTPGTVSADVSHDKRWLLIHCLSLEDEQELLDGIQQRYEAPLMEIFRC